VVIVREKHPLQGKALRVLGRMHRAGALHLILSLPDGGSSLIPETWTDLSGGAPSPSVRVLGSVADLRHTRRVVDVLLRRQDTARTRPAEEEEADATGTVSNRSAVTRPTVSAGPPEPGATRSTGQDIGASAGQNPPATKERGEP
jgi:hypothetical protein